MTDLYLADLTLPDSPIDAPLVSLPLRSAQNKEKGPAPTVQRVEGTWSGDRIAVRVQAGVVVYTGAQGAWQSVDRVEAGGWWSGH